MRSRLVTAGVLATLAYTVVPYMASRVFGWRVTKSLNSQYVALTFDDGPDPVYTGELLDLLQQEEIQATFFVVGHKAEAHPDIIRRMQEEGHQVGIHNYVHRPNWSMRPATVRNGIERTATVIERITGERPTVYRPPWGALNAGDILCPSPYKMVLWSKMAEDWKLDGGKAKIKRLLADVSAGDIILLHDNGETFGADLQAPVQTIAALRELIPEWKARGLQFRRIDQT
ncbi:polysaccharide deacetylase family protein [Exiguobacterium sp. TDN 0502]|uniref:polysaccharide deacetylase family protein n=1 Tax=Exiguobacterium sp. TDN 0502 TaxID=3420731 RepID=UPI003D77FF93